MSFQISQWQKHFPNGVSQSNYERIGRIIRKKGMFVTVSLQTLDADERQIELTTVLKKLENQQ